MTKPGKPGLWRAGVALLVGGTLALSGGAAALAAPAITPGETGSITIHKYEQPETVTGLPNDGREIVSTDLTAEEFEKFNALVPLENVEFTATQVPGIDLATNKGWEDAQALIAAGTAPDLSAATNKKTGLTAADGSLAFDALQLGLYYVQETGPLKGYTATAPFFVTVPLTNPVNQNEWLYNVHVYPKNFRPGVEKTATEGDATRVGDKLTWAIKMTVPTPAKGEAFKGFRVTDTLDEKLGYVSASVSLDGVALNDADYAADASGQKVAVNLTASGIEKLAAAPGKQIVFNLVTEVKALGVIPNVAEIYSNIDDNETIYFTPGHNEDPENPGPNPAPVDPENPDAPVDPNNPFDPSVPVLKFGAAVFNKVNASDNTALEGAEFNVFLTEADAKAGTNPLFTAPAVSGADGKVLISGLRFSNWANNAEVAPGDTNYRTYWLAETKAPAGFELLAAPVSFTVTSVDTVTIPTTGDHLIKNVASNAGWTLPITGGTGTTFLMVGGLLLVGGAVVLTVRKRRAAQAAA